MADIASVIDKVQKLRRLARSENPNEAAAAAAAADRLIQEHGLAEAQLQADGKQAAETVTEDQSPLAAWTGKTPTWQRILASGLARHYDCASYLVWIRSNTLAHKIIGRPSDLATVRYMWGWLSVEIERLAQLHKGEGRSWLDSFRRGAVDGVLDKLYESKRAAREEVQAKVKLAAAISPDLAAPSAALVIYDRRRQEAVDAMKELHPDVAKRMKRSRGGRSFNGPSRHDAFGEGKRAGSNIHVGASLGASSQTRSLKQ